MEYGEINTLGRHKLLCGDATKKEDIMRLVDNRKIDLLLQDPPYGTSFQTHKKNYHIGGSGGGWFKSKNVISYELCIGDNDTTTAKKNYELVKKLTQNQIIWGGNYFTNFLPPSGGWIFWDKERPADLSFGAGELAWCSSKNIIKKYSHKWNGCIMEGAKLLNPCPRLHPMQKPVELYAKILEDYSPDRAVVLDCFGGSGTTLIACEITGRTCLMMEFSPSYCEIIKSRYENVSEQYPLFLGSNGF